MIVVAALIKKGDKFLIAQRSTGEETVLGKWEFPGGKVETLETEEEAIEREIKEEFEIAVIAKRFITRYVHGKVDLRLYECEYISGDYKLHDHSNYKWVTFSEAEFFDLAPADRVLLTKIGGEYGA